MARCRSGGTHEQFPIAHLDFPRNDPFPGVEAIHHRRCPMILLGALVFTCLAVFANLLIHPVRSALAMVRLFCAIFGTVELLAALVSFRHGAHLEAVGFLAGAMFLFWCGNKLDRRETA